MGWLFGKKKPKVPLPEGKPLDEKTLQFPSAPPKEKIVEPAEVKAAAGVDKPTDTPIEAPAELPAVPAKPEEAPAPIPSTIRESLHVKVDVYQRILGELENLKHDLSYLDETNRRLDSSEYNEESNFDKLRKAIKSMHDRLLQMDKVLFKIQGG